MQAVDGATLELTAGFDDACGAVERELGRHGFAKVHQETYVLADGTKARTWVGVVAASPLTRLRYGLFVRIHASGPRTQVVLYVLGDAEREIVDKDLTDVVAKLKAGLQGARA